MYGVDENLPSWYGPDTFERNNQEHPIIEKIHIGETPISKILPKGLIDQEKWLPTKLKFKKWLLIRDTKRY